MTTSAPHATHELRLRQLALYLSEAERILAAWDTYSDENTDLDGWPHDDTAYGLRQSQRDAETWRAFNRVRHGAQELLATAEVQLQKLPGRSIQPRWAWQIATLHTALDHLTTLQSEWLDLRDTLPPSARPGLEGYDEPLAEPNAKAWHYLDEWVLHGQAVLDIYTTVRQRRPGLTTLAPAPTPALPGQAATPAPARR
ncbi:hypothetical protein AB0G42_16710 [Streptomyces yangpuensis]|uniref:hypothetical protein n=1 Tax=Streptomyces yangpuensis TaxID=1648182 RepID=UPI003433CC7C